MWDEALLAPTELVDVGRREEIDQEAGNICQHGVLETLAQIRAGTVHADRFVLKQDKASKILRSLHHLIY